MKKQITQISIHQTAKVFAILYFVIIAIITVPTGIYYAFYLSDMMNAAAMFLAPFFGLILNYILSAIICALYNLIAKAFGGIEITFTDVQ
jgi:hypothetical protein